MTHEIPYVCIFITYYNDVYYFILYLLCTIIVNIRLVIQSLNKIINNNITR